MRYLNTLLKLTLLIGMGGLLWYELSSNVNLYPAWLSFWEKSENANSSWLLMALFLMPLNAVVELQKWYPIVRRYEPLSRFAALQAVFSGATLSIFSPARIGEYGGRVLHIRSGNRMKAFGVHLTGNLAQFVVLILFGTAGVLWCLKNLWIIDGNWWMLCAVLATGGSVFTLLFYFHFQQLLPFLSCLPLLKSIKGYVKYFPAFARLSQTDLRRILGWSVLRYAVSCCQYYFLLQFFGIETGVLAGFSCIAGIFLVQTCIPLPPAVNFFARGNVAIWVWSSFGTDEFTCLAVTYLLWIINLFLPALLGTFSILHVNITKTLGYENE